MWIKEKLVMNWQQMSIDPNDPQKLLKAKDMREVFEAAMVTLLHADDKLHATTVLERQQMA
jgi:hypothetical protein